MKKRTRKTKLVSKIADLVPAFLTLAIASVVLNIMTKESARIIGKEMKNKSTELKLMGVIEVVKKDKTTKVEYHYIKGINNYIKNFLKQNPKWKFEYEDYFGIKTGRIILTRIYRNYHKKVIEEENCCSECGRSYEE